MRSSLAERFPRLRALYRRLPLPRAARVWLSQLRWRIERWLASPEIAQAKEIEQTQLGPVKPSRRDQRDILIFAIIDWHFRFQRPQQLARELARRGHRVFYLSVNLTLEADLGYRSESVEPGVEQIYLHVGTPLVIYTQQASAEQFSWLRAGLARLKRDFEVVDSVHLVQHPFWAPLAACFGEAALVYDCMDHHAGFHSEDFVHAGSESQLIREADLCVVSSALLRDLVAPQARRAVLIRNAGDPVHFSQGQSEASPASSTVGYFGAIAEWFDLEAVRQMAQAHPTIQFELIGDDTIGAARALRGCPNLRFLGEQPYAALPAQIQHWALALIPFRRIPLTLATNPVKVYEYLGAAKAVLATRLPELEPIAEALPASIWLAEQPQDFARLLPTALQHERSEAAKTVRSDRVRFALRQTWADRADDLLLALGTPLAPEVTAIVVTFNQWRLTQRCLESLVQSEAQEPLEIIVIDNGSADETPIRLEAWRAEQAQLGRPHRIALLGENRGFGGGVNEGLRMAQGSFLAILNNDLVASPSWARSLRRHLLRRPDLGLICPTTNHIGNEAQVWLPGDTPEELIASAHWRSLAYAGETIPLHVAAFFCVMMPRAVYAAVGELDEAFFPGYFEDDDYCYRVRAAGYEIACAEDVFVYHELSASFNVDGAAKRQALLDRNRQLFESKWGPWKPHQYRPESLPPR